MQNYWNLDLWCKRTQLTGPVHYRDFRETGPWTVRLWDPGFCLKPSISVYVRDRLALGACSLFGTNFCWFGSSSRSSFLWNEILLFSRSKTVRLREPVLVIYGPGPFIFEGETRRWRCHPALTSVRNALQKPETVYDLKRLLLTSRSWLLPHFFVDPGGPSQRLYSGHWSELGSTKDKGIPPPFSPFAYCYSFVLRFPRIRGCTRGSLCATEPWRQMVRHKQGTLILRWPQRIGGAFE